VRPIARQAAARVAVITLGAAIALFATSGYRARIVDVYVLVLGGVLLLALVRVARLIARSQADSVFDRAWAAMLDRTPKKSELELDRDVVLSHTSAFHYYTRVRPVLREVVATRLQQTYGVDVEREPERARELVPKDAWEVVRPDLAPPADRLGRGPSVGAQRTVLEQIESL